MKTVERESPACPWASKVEKSCLQGPNENEAQTNYLLNKYLKIVIKEVKQLKITKIILLKLV